MNLYTIVIAGTYTGEGFKPPEIFFESRKFYTTFIY